MFNLKTLFNKKITLDIEDTTSNVDNIGTSTESLELKINLLKKQDSEYLDNEKNDDYSRTLFLYEMGFVKMRRVISFIDTMKKIGNIEEFKELERKYYKYGLTLLNTEMLKIVEKEFSLKKQIHTKYEGELSNKVIDTFKTNYDKIKKIYVQYSYFRKYYDSDPYVEVTDSSTISSFLATNTYSIDRGKKDISHSSYYWKLVHKDILLYHNNTKGVIMMEVEKGHYLVFAEWTDEDNSFINKMNFKEFVQNNL